MYATVPSPSDVWPALRPPQDARRLPEPLASAVREVIADWDAGTPEAETLLFPHPSLVVRVVPISGPAGTGMAVLLERFRAAAGALEARAAEFRLSPRELEVVKQLLAGATVEEIARTLNIAEPTVAAHVRNVTAKTGARRRSEMIARLLTQ